MDQTLLDEIARRTEAVRTAVTSEAELQRYLSESEAAARSEGEVGALHVEPAMAAIRNVYQGRPELQQKLEAFNDRMAALSAQLDPGVRSLGADSPVVPR